MVCKLWQKPNIFLSSLIKLSQWAFIIWTQSVENVDNFVSTWIGCKRRAHGGQLQRRFYLINISLFSTSKQESNSSKKRAFFPHFYLPLSLINWKVSTYENQYWKIQEKSFCINLAIIVKYLILLMYYMNCFFSLQYAMLVPAVVLFAFGILIYFCLIPSPDEIGEYKYL